MFIGTVIECIAFLSQLKEGTYEIHEHKEKRSLKANALYWTGVSELAKAMKMPSAYIHNLLLRKCGFMQTFGGDIARVLLDDTDVVENQTMYDENIHLMPVRGDSGRLKTLNDNREVVYKRWYVLLKHSSDFDKDEMSTLIETLAEEMKSAGLTPPQDKIIQKALENFERRKKQ